MKSLLLPLALVAGLSGCVAYGDPPRAHVQSGVYAQPGYTYSQPGYTYSQPGYTYGQPRYLYNGPVVYGAQPVYRYDGYEQRGGRGMRDRDGDGIPDRYDRDRDGDGVRNRDDARPNNPRRY